MANDDENLIGGLFCIVAALFAISVILFLVVTAFTTIFSAGALWGLALSSKNFFVAAKKNIGNGV